MDFFDQIASQIDVFLLILARVSGIFLASPFFSNRIVPKQVKALLIVILSIVLFSGLHLKVPVIPGQLGPFTVYLISEIMIGFVIGFVAQFTFAAVQFAGQAIDMQAGFAIVNVVDPVYGTQAPLIGTFNNLLALLLFLVVDGHHYIIAALYQSYQRIPLFGLSNMKQTSQMIIDLFGGMLVTGMKLAIPVVGAIFVAEMALGIMARTVPQMQVFFVGIPLKIFLGILLLLIVIPAYLATMHLLFDSNYQDMLRIIKIMG